MENKVRMAAEKFIINRCDWDLIAEDMPYLVFGSKDEDGTKTIHYVRVQYRTHGKMPAEQMPRSGFERCMMDNMNAIPKSMFDAGVAFHNISFAINDAGDGAMIRWHENYKFKE